VALKLPDGCEKLVIEAVCGKPVRIYVKGWADGGAVPTIAAALTHVADVNVSDLGEVVVDASRTKPTLEELDAILNSEDDRPVKIMPDGTVRELDGPVNAEGYPVVKIPFSEVRRRCGLPLNPIYDEYLPIAEELPSAHGG